ncbi:MAG: hypothetical protein EBZ36_12865 [Acidobacteria bacterium]|nr:hypothetical protein [Acidobacteriota bacterium]
MQVDNGKSAWVLLSVESESVCRELMELLRSEGIALNRLTVIRVDGEPRTRSWAGQRQPSKGARTAVEPGSRVKSLRGQIHWMLPGLVAGIIAIFAHLVGFSRSLTFGVAATGLISIGLAMWLRRRPEWSARSTTTSQERSSSGTAEYHQAGAPSEPEVGSSDGNDESLDQCRSELILAGPMVAGPMVVGIKMAESERERVERIIIESGAGRMVS